MTDIIKEFWQIIVGLIGLAVWLIRLESRGLQNTKEIERIWRSRAADMEARNVQRKEDMAAAKEQREEFRKMLHEIQQDVKKLLGQRN